MTRPARLVTLCISTLCACNGGGGADDEVAETGSTGESTTEVSTFESSGDEPTSGSTEATCSCCWAGCSSLLDLLNRSISVRFFFGGSATGWLGAADAASVPPP